MKEEATHVWLSIQTLLLFSLSEVESRLHVKSVCTLNPTPIHLTCSIQALVNIRHAYYGVSRTGGCQFTPGDCHRLDHDRHQLCDGRSDCLFNVGPIRILDNSLSIGKMSQSESIANRCAGLHENTTSDYYQIVYQCIPVEEVHDICRVHKLDKQSGYLISPSFPDFYSTNRNCSVKLDLSKNIVNQRISFTVLEMHLDCKNFLQIVDPLGKSWQDCKKTRRNHVFTSLSNQVYIHYFVAADNMLRLDRGFWLYYEASPMVLIRKVLPQLPPNASPNCSGINNEPNIPKLSKESELQVYPGQKKTTQRLINSSTTYKVVIILSVLITILVVLLVIISASFASKKLRLFESQDNHRSRRKRRSRTCHSFKEEALLSDLPTQTLDLSSAQPTPPQKIQTPQYLGTCASSRQPSYSEDHQNCNNLSVRLLTSDRTVHISEV